MNIIEQSDQEFARRLQQEEYDTIIDIDRETASQFERGESDKKENKTTGGFIETGSESVISTDISPVDPLLEHTDPNPDIRLLFIHFNDQFFWGRLSGIEVKWSPRMTLCAGLCVYEGSGGLCSVRLSLPLLKLRPRKDLVETLLHEMIHAYLFITDNDRDHDGHGPQFQKHMHRINKATGASISVYHTFHDEVASYQQHWWRCNGPCKNRKPFYGYVKRAMNRAPSSNDFWWSEHKASCDGTFDKIKEPEGYGKKKGGKKGENGKWKKDIRSFGGHGNVLGSKPSSTENGKRSIFGTGKNPATIFNTKDIGAASKSSAPTPANAQSSVIINGVLHKGSKNVDSPLFSNISSSAVRQKTESHSKVGSDIKPQSRLNGESQSSSKSQADSWPGGGFDDDDDLCMIDIKDLDISPQSKNVNAISQDFKTSVGSGSNHVKHVSGISKDHSQKGKRKTKFLSNNGKQKKSVCAGSVFYDEMKKKKKRYILDELDSNDNLWDVPHSGSIAGRKANVKTESCVSPLEVKLEQCNVKDEKTNCFKDEAEAFQSNLSENNSSQYIKSERPHSSQTDIRSVFSGRGYRLGSGDQGISLLAQPRGNMKDKDSVFKASGSGVKRSSDEAFACHIVDDSEDEDSESQLLSSKKRKSDTERSVPVPRSGSSAFDDGIDESEAMITHSHSNGNESGKKVTCPVCSALILEAEINIHLDLCLWTGDDT